MPYQPKLQDATDISSFETMFTRERPVDSVVPDTGADATGGGTDAAGKKKGGGGIMGLFGYGNNTAAASPGGAGGGKGGVGKEGAEASPGGGGGAGAAASAGSFKGFSFAKEDSIASMDSGGNTPTDASVLNGNSPHGTAGGTLGSPSSPGSGKSAGAARFSGFTHPGPASEGGQS